MTIIITSWIAAILLLLQIADHWHTVEAGYCNSASSNCGAYCTIQSDCPGGDCWAAQDDCGYAGYCNAVSSNCGARCNIQSDCPGGDCWAAQDDCGDYAGYCNADSSNCGAQCNIQSDCPGGDCWKEKDDCGSHAGYCNADSSNCGAPCDIQSDCPGGDCWKDPPQCGGGGDHIIGTYMGAIPGGITAPQPLSVITKSVNLIMLSFATDPNHDGHFIPFSEWVRQGLTWENINTDKTNNPGRKYLISLGGAADYGGWFDIQAGMSTDTWVANAVASVSSIINGYAADGAEMQFEGNTGHPQFYDAMVGLLNGLKSKGYITAIGPFYGGTWPDYKRIPLQYYDYNNLQLYATGTNTVSGVVDMINNAVSDVGGDWSKLIAGFNSFNRVPDPSVALQTVDQLKGTLRGMFTWDIEHSQSNHPNYCLEDNSANILNNGGAPGSCSW